MSKLLEKQDGDVEFNYLEDFFWQEHFLRENFPMYRGQWEHRGNILDVATVGFVESGGTGNDYCYTYDNFGGACTNAFAQMGTVWGGIQGKTSNSHTVVGHSDFNSNIRSVI